MNVKEEIQMQSLPLRKIISGTKYQLRMYPTISGSENFSSIYPHETGKSQKIEFSFRSPHRMSPQLSLLETERQRREEIRRIILEKKGGYRVDTDIEICLVYGLTSLI